MEVHLSPDKEARIQQSASRTGRNAEQVVEEAVDRMLESDERFVAAVEEGRTAARRGDLLEHREVGNVSSRYSAHDASRLDDHRR